MLSELVIPVLPRTEPGGVLFSIGTFKTGFEDSKKFTPLIFEEADVLLLRISFSEMGVTEFVLDLTVFCILIAIRISGRNMIKIKETIPKDTARPTFLCDLIG